MFFVAFNEVSCMVWHQISRYVKLKSNHEMKIFLNNNFITCLWNVFFSKPTHLVSKTDIIWELKEYTEKQNIV